MEKKRYSFCWNNEEKTEAVIIDTKTGEFNLIRMKDGDHQSKIILSLNKNASILPEYLRFRVTDKNKIIKPEDL